MNKTAPFSSPEKRRNSTENLRESERRGEEVLVLSPATIKTALYMGRVPNVPTMYHPDVRVQNMGFRNSVLYRYSNLL